MKIVLLAISILTFAIYGKAQQDEKAKNILSQVSEKTSSYQTIQADFSYSMKNEEMEINDTNEGTIKLKGQKYCISIPDAGFEMYSDGKTLWNYMKDGNQVIISNVEEGEDVMDNPASLFRIYEKGFKSKFVKESVEGGKSVYIIELTPEDENQDIQKVMVTVDKNALMLKSATLYSTDGNQYIIDVKKMETNNNLADSNFIFNKANYPDVEVVDLR